MRRFLLGDLWHGAEAEVQTGWVEIAATLVIALLIVVWMVV